MRLYVATGNGFARLDEGEGVWAVERALDGAGARCVAADAAERDTVYVGLREEGLRRSADGGRTWSECPLPQSAVYSVAVSPADGAVYAGTEPSALYRSDDGGTSRPGAQRDVHSLAWRPVVEGRAYEAGGGGAAWSDDGGESWHEADEGRDRHYTWPVAVDPVDPERWYVSASTGPVAAHGRGDPQARIYRRRDGGWEALRGGLPEPLPAMPYALLAAGERLFAGLADGQLWQSTDRGDTWSRCSVDGELPGIVALALAA